MTVALKVCSVCGKPSRRARCPKHEATERQRRNKRVKAYGYDSKNWQQLRRQALMVGVCQLRMDGCTTVATHVHLDPALHGDHRRATIHDVTACCANCSGAIDAPRAQPLKGRGPA